MKKYMSRFAAICLALGIFLSVFPVGAVEYTDVGKNHWAHDYITYLSEKGVLAGDGNGRFRPDASVTRAEFIKMMTATFGLTETKPVSYTKVPDWAHQYIEAAAAQGFLLNYKTDADFSAALSRQEAVALLMRYLGFAADKAYDSTRIKDYSDITEGYQPYVLAAVSNGIVTGYEDGSFRPKKILTRAEALTLLYQAAGAIYNVSASAVQPEGNEKNATVNASVTLSGIALSGNVYITEGAKFVTLTGCTVDGTLYVRTGTYISLSRTKINKIVVQGNGATFSLSNTSEIARLEAHGKMTAVINASCMLTTAIFYDGAGESIIKGTGKLENFGVYCNDAVCEIEPDEYYVATNCSARIGGVIYGSGSGKFESCGLGMAQARAVDGKIEVEANALTDGTVYAAVWMNHEQPLSAAQIQQQAAETVHMENGAAVQLELTCLYAPSHYTVGIVVVPDGQNAAALTPLYTQQMLLDSFAAMGTKEPSLKKISAPAAQLWMGEGIVKLEFDQILYYKEDDGKLTTLTADAAFISISAESAFGIPVETGKYVTEICTDNAKTSIVVYFSNGIAEKTRYILTISDRLFTVYGSAPSTLVYSTDFAETASCVQPVFAPIQAHICQAMPLTITMPTGVPAMCYTYTINAQEPSLSMTVQGDAQLSFDTLPSNSHVRITASALSASGTQIGLMAQADYIVNAAPVIVLGGVSYAGNGNAAHFSGPASVSAVAPSGLDSADYMVRLYINGKECMLTAFVETAGVQIRAELFYQDVKIGESSVTL